MHPFFRVAALSLALIATGTLSGCGDNEPAERKAFIAFLQTHVLEKPGVHVPKPTDADNKSFGSYASHYTVISNFTADPDMIAIGKQMAQALQVGAPRSLQEVLDRQQDVQTIRETLAQLRGPLDQKFAAAEAARDALMQPPDLKAVFAAAFDRDVGDPARAFRGALPVAEAALGSVLTLATYLHGHRSAVTIRGSDIQVSDKKVMAEINTLLQDMNAKGRQLQEAQRKVRIALTGS